MSMWEILPNAKTHLILGLYLQIFKIFILVTYLTLHLILYPRDPRIMFVFSVGIFLPMIFTAAAWG